MCIQKNKKYTNFFFNAQYKMLHMEKALRQKTIKMLQKKINIYKYIFSYHQESHEKKMHIKGAS